MIRFFEEYMGSYNPFEDRGCDEQRILRNSLYAVLPKIVKNELTQKQRLCFEMFYIDKKNQKEILIIKFTQFIMKKTCNIFVIMIVQSENKMALKDIYYGRKR